MIVLVKNKLIFRFPEIHKDAICKIEFQRTLRIPDDNREYPLPPGLGNFPLEHVADYSARLPKEWAEHGGVLLPMYQAEAMWISLSSGFNSYPFAVKIATGKTNAITGSNWSNELSKNEQDYIVIPEQPWLDGFCVGKGLIRQFIAMPLGAGYTAEEQISGSAEHGGLQFIVYPMKRDRYEALFKLREFKSLNMPILCNVGECDSMGLAAGGLMRQEIYDDEYGYDAWDMSTSSRCFVHILNSNQWQTVTGKNPPTSSPSALEYTEAGLPWFEYYDDKLNALDGSTTLAGLDSVAAKEIKLGDNPLPNNDAISPTNIISLGTKSDNVSEGNW